MKNSLIIFLALFFCACTSTVYVDLEDKGERAQIPVVGIAGAAALVASAAYYAYKTYDTINDGLTDETTPVRQYKKSYNGGWDAHLVPIQ